MTVFPGPTPPDGLQSWVLNRGLLALTASLWVSLGAWAQTPTPPPARPPSIEELKKQLEAKRLELKQQQEAKRQLDAKLQQEAKQQQDAKAQAEANRQLAAKQQLEAKQKPKVPSVDREVPATPVAPAAARAAAAPSDGVKVPPVAKNVLPIKLEPNSAAATDSCPYPAAALKRGDTGTVILLIYVAPDGRAADTQVETSSGSDVLDEAAAGCVKEFGHFVPKRVGARAESAWFRMKFRWSFGD